MFKDRTKDVIHAEMLESISNDYDKTVGSFIWDSTSPPADKFGEAYQDLDKVVDKLSIENLKGDELTQRVQERTGLERKAATHATTIVTVVGIPGATINIGDKVSSDTVFYSFQESKIIDATGSVEVLVKCDEEGIIGNVPANNIVNFPITLQGLVSVTNKNPVTNGYDAESDDILLQRYYERLQTPPTSGNKAHYRNWAKEVVGVGGAKIFPLWNGDNTVKVVLIDSNYMPADNELVESVQEHIDPGITGTGDGEAPIGAFCTVVSANDLPINVSFTAVKNAAFTDEQRIASCEKAITDYLKELAKTSFSENLTQYEVSYARVGALILGADGIDDYSDLTINNGETNIVIDQEDVAVMGVITIA